MKYIVISALLVFLSATACGVVPGNTPRTPTTASTPVPTLPPAPTNTPPPTATHTPVPTATATALPTPANSKDALNKIFKAWSSVKSYRAKITSTTLATMATGTPAAKAAATPTIPVAQNMTFEVVLPDRYHITAANLEVYLVAKTAYTKIGSKWQKGLMPKGIDLGLVDPSVYASNFVTATNISFVGFEALEGTPTVVFQYTASVQGQPARKIPYKVWAGAMDNLPRQFVFEPNANQTTTITLSDNDSNITINPPS